MSIEGIWLPIITPFIGNEIDYESYKRLINHYIEEGISGIIPAGTTGESPTISDYELEKLTEASLEYANNRIPTYMGIGGNYTDHVLKRLRIAEKHKIDGILSVSPYFNNPDQRGIYEHYRRISESTNLNIIIYNIPPRTCVTIENDTVRKLAELENIIGLKDSSGNLKQAMDLLLNPPSDFSIIAGDDILFYSMFALGAPAAILASAHLKTKSFVEIYNLVKGNNHIAALERWRELYPLIPPLFKEPNPAPIKHCLKKAGIIESSESRMPIMEASDRLRQELDLAFDR